MAEPWNPAGDGSGQSPYRPFDRHVLEATLADALREAEAATVDGPAVDGAPSAPDPGAARPAPAAGLRPAPLANGASSGPAAVPVPAPAPSPRPAAGAPSANGSRVNASSDLGATAANGGPRPVPGLMKPGPIGTVPSPGPAPAPGLSAPRPVPAPGPAPAPAPAPAPGLSAPAGLTSKGLGAAALSTGLAANGLASPGLKAPGVTPAPTPGPAPLAATPLRPPNLSDLTANRTVSGLAAAPAPPAEQPTIPLRRPKRAETATAPEAAAPEPAHVPAPAAPRVLAAIPPWMPADDDIVPHGQAKRRSRRTKR